MNWPQQKGWVAVGLVPWPGGWASSLLNPEARGLIGRDSTNSNKGIWHFWGQGPPPRGFGEHWKNRGDFRRVELIAVRSIQIRDFGPLGFIGR